MNPYEIIRAEHLVQECGKYFNYTTEFALREKKVVVDVPDFGMDREGTPIQLYPA